MTGKKEYRERENYRAGKRLLDEGKLEEAEIQFKEALINEDHSETRAKIINQIGVLYACRKDFHTAKRYFEEAIHTNQSFPPPYSNMGNIFFEQLQFEEAIEWYRKALEIDDGYSTARLNLGAALKKTGKYDEAVRCFRSSHGSGFGNLFGRKRDS